MFQENRPHADPRLRNSSKSHLLPPTYEPSAQRFEHLISVRREVSKSTMRDFEENEESECIYRCARKVSTWMQIVNAIDINAKIRPSSSSRED